MKSYYLFIWFMLMVVTLGKRPTCIAPSSCMITSMHCHQGCCNTIECYSGGCKINECNPALQDPCWGMACENGRFNQTKWNTMSAVWIAEEDTKKWNALLEKYHYTIQPECTSRDVTCYPIPAVVPFEFVSQANVVCCMPNCAEHFTSVYSDFMDTLMYQCTFEANSQTGFVMMSK